MCMWRHGDRDNLGATRHGNVQKSAYHYRKVGASKPPKRQSLNMSTKTVISYLCGMEGHTKSMCPRNSEQITQMCFVPRQSVEPKVELEKGLKILSVELNGKTLKALLDSGSTQTLIHRNFVPANKVNIAKTIRVCCVHGDEKPYTTADMHIKVQGQIYLVNIGVAENLPFPAVLPVLFDLLNTNHTCNVAVTRAQAIKKRNLLTSSVPCLFKIQTWRLHPGSLEKPREIPTHC